LFNIFKWFALSIKQQIANRLYDEKVRSARIMAFSHLFIITLLLGFYEIVPKASEVQSFSFSFSFRPLEIFLGFYFLMICVRLYNAIQKNFNPILTHILVFCDFALLTGIIFSYHFEYQQASTLSLKSPTYVFYFMLIAINAIAKDRSILIASGTWALVMWSSLVIYVGFDKDTQMTHSFVEYINGGKFLVGAEIEKIIGLGATFMFVLLATIRSQRIFEKTVAELSESIHKTKSQKKELDTAYQHLQEALSTKTNFLSRISHELRTPINVLVGRVGSLKSPHPDLLKNTTVLLEMVDNIITLNEINSPDIKKEKFNPIEVVENSIDIFTPDLMPGVKIIKSFGFSDEMLFLGHKHYLKRLFNILISNSVKYTSQGEIIIYLSYQKDKNQLYVRISDSGDGFDRDKMELFESLDSVGDSSNSGLGLGLITLKRIVDLLNGTVHLYSDLGHGTTYDIRIPLNDVSEVNKNGEDRSPWKKFTEITQLEPAPSVLVVDDNPSNLVLAKAMLKKLGCNVITAENGMESLDQIVKNDDLDLILMDCMMPVMDGYTATKQIRSDICSKIPIIALTAHALQKDREKALMYGMNDHITKPVNISELKKMILKYVVVYRLDKVSEKAIEKKAG
jgi:signal transduction histidine kinase/CheY-like chemotaxis protein